MTNVPSSPFSARNRRERNWIENDFPDSARTGLLHLLTEAVDGDYVSGWPVVARELGRIARTAPRNYRDTSVQSAREAQLDVETNLNQLHWEKVYDFCERLYSHLTQDIVRWRSDVEVAITKEQSQLFFAEEIERLFEEENLGYEFRDGLVQRRGKRHTINQINKAERSLDDHKLDAARMHFSKALRYFHDRKKPDHENTVKEAVCAVEAAAKELFPDAKAKTLACIIREGSASVAFSGIRSPKTMMAA